MRYTTLIDITELRQVYRNIHARLIYMHMVLKAGYHDDDRDVCSISIRSLAADTGLTVSATRHALKTLEANGLLTRTNGTWVVKKFVVSAAPSPRRQDTATRASKDVTDLMRRTELEAEDYRRRLDQAIDSLTKEQLETWIHELEEGSTRKHCGIRVNPTQGNIEWMKSKLKAK